MKSEDILICPTCKEGLTRKEHSYLCKNNHCYDIAKEGYVNLLVCNKKKTKFPGDDKIMIEARNRFLQKGYFDCLREELENIVNKNSPAIILDAGCGTGYYTHNLENEFDVVAIDISKDAVKFTSRNNKKTLSVVASIFDIPLRDKLVDVILNIFAPKPQEEFARVLKTGGRIVEVVPGEEHIIELKEKIFSKNCKFNKEKFAFSNFNLKTSNHLKYKVQIEKAEELADLLRMTPYFYNGGDKQIDKIDGIENFNVTLDFIINIWEGKW